MQYRNSKLKDLHLKEPAVALRLPAAGRFSAPLRAKIFQNRLSDLTTKMIIKHVPQLPFFIAGDETHLTEVLHPKNDLVELPYSIAYATIAPGKASLPHTLGGSETYIFTAGKGAITVNKTTQKVQPGVIVLVPPNERQFVENQGDTDLCFYCIVTPAWSEEEEKIE